MAVTQTFIFIKAIFIKIWRICKRPKRFGFSFNCPFDPHHLPPFISRPFIFLLCQYYGSHIFFGLLIFLASSILPCSFFPPVFCFPTPPPPLPYLFVTEKLSNDHFCYHTELHVGSSIGPGTLQCSFKPWSYLSSWGRLRQEIMTWYI